MTKKKLLIGFSLCLVLFSVLFFLFRFHWRPKSEPIPLLPLVQEEDAATRDILAETPQLKEVQIALVNMDQHVNWKLTVEQVIEEEEVCLLFGIKGEYYTASGQKYLIEAAEGEMGKDFSWLRLTPEVVLTGEEIKMVAAEVNWEAAVGEEISGHQMQADGENVKIQAEKFTFNPEERSMNLPGTSRWFYQ